MAQDSDSMPLAVPPACRMPASACSVHLKCCEVFEQMVDDDELQISNLQQYHDIYKYCAMAGEMTFIGPAENAVCEQWTADVIVYFDENAVPVPAECE